MRVAWLVLPVLLSACWPLSTGAFLLGTPATSVAPAFDVPVFEGVPELRVPPDAVRIPVGADALAIVAASPAGSAFLFEAGVHRVQRPIVPRDGDAFFGEPGAVLSGAVPLAPDGFEDGLWFADGLDLDARRHGTCRSDRSGCNLRHDLFIDGVALLHVASVSDVAPGRWSFDAERARAVWADDPAGRELELSVAAAAIAGDANDVVVAHLIVERFANPAQRGALMAERVGATTSFGQGWLIVGNEVRWNHGVGVRAGGGAHIVGNHVHHNGQLGIASVGPGPTRVEANTIAFNNFAGYSEGWEAGGTKFVRTDGLVVRHNHVHRNQGPGLWTDIDNVRTVIEHNLVEHNAGSGIFHEISYAAVIRHNEVRGNGLALGLERYAYVYGAGILVANSPNVSVYANRVAGNWNGIVGLHQDRGSGALGPWVLSGLRVYGNEVTMLYHPDGVGPRGETGVPGVSGVAQDIGRSVAFGALLENRFEANHYLVGDVRLRHFTWNDRWLTFSQWQRCGERGVVPGCSQDSAGTVRVDPGLGSAARR